MRALERVQRRVTLQERPETTSYNAAMVSIMGMVKRPTVRMSSSFPADMRT